MQIFAPLPKQALAWSRSLVREPDTELRGEGYLHLADRLAREERWDAAAEIYGALQADPALSPGLRRRAATSLAPLSGQGDFGRRFELWTQSFFRHATDPAGLAAMSAGALAFRVVRLGVAERLLARPAAFATRGPAAQGLAAGSGFLCEVLAFTSVGRGLAPGRSDSWSRDLAHAALSLGALKSLGALGARFPRRLSSRFLGQGLLLGGIFLGAHAERLVGLREEKPDLWAGLGTLLHFNVGGALSRRWLGEKFARWEMGLDYRFREGPKRPPPDFGSSLAWAAAGQNPAPKESSPTLPHFLAERHGGESGLPASGIRRLEEKYLRLFPRDEENGFYSPEIVKRACRIRCDLPDFHENLLEALSRESDRGRLSQLYTVMAIERVFSTDALSASRGSFGYAPLQFLLAHALTEPNGILRHRTMREIFQTFERGFGRNDAIWLLEKFTAAPRLALQESHAYDLSFHRRHGETAGRLWAHYRPEDLVPLFNFVHRQAAHRPEEARRMIETLAAGRDPRSPYLSAELDEALDYARLHPFGHLVMNRFYHILAADDLPGKLREIAGDPPKIPTDRYLEALRRQGYAREEIVERLNGSAHTAYFNDLRLAQKIVSVFEEVGPYLRQPQYRENNRNRLLGQFFLQARRRHPLSESDLFRLLKAGRYTQADFFERAWRDGEFRVEILPERNFRQEVGAWGGTQDCEWSLFVQASGRGAKDRILIRELPPLNTGSSSERDLAFSEMLWRLRGLVHELEHWRHFSGRGGGEATRPFRLVGISREERLVTEIMAYMEEFRWRAMNSDDHYWQISRRLGDTLPLFLRNVAEESYF